MAAAGADSDPASAVPAVSTCAHCARSHLPTSTCILYTVPVTSKSASTVEKWFQGSLWMNIMMKTMHRYVCYHPKCNVLDSYIIMPVSRCMMSKMCFHFNAAIVLSRIIVDTPSIFIYMMFVN
uniref:Uncharacterized protein n=1 Tax=Setaria italica TaxID=4555 RepID=K4APF3_SETIT